MKKLPISVYMVANKEEERIAMALTAVVDFADEIIVVINDDCPDNTAKIAESFGAKVIHRKWEGFAYQKAFGAKQCKNDWVLDLDADEEVSPELQAKLQELFGGKKLPEEGGFLMTWKIMYPGQTKPGRFSKTDYIIRLYNKKKAAIKEEKFSNNDRPKVHTGKVGRIEEPVFHRTILDFSHLERKMTQLTQEQAQHNVNKGKKISNLKLFTDFQLKFWKYFILRRMFLQGWYGYTLALMAAYRNYMRLAKTRELYLVEEQNKAKKTK